MGGVDSVGRRDGIDDLVVVGAGRLIAAETVEGVIVSNRINDSTFPGRETTDLAGVVAPAGWTARVEQLRVTTSQVPAGQRTQSDPGRRSR